MGRHDDYRETREEQQEAYRNYENRPEAVLRREADALELADKIRASGAKYVLLFGQHFVAGWSSEQEKRKDRQERCWTTDHVCGSWKSYKRCIDLCFGILRDRGIKADCLPG